MDFIVDKNYRFSELRRERIEKILVSHYSDQPIFIKSHDGINFVRSGALIWIKILQKAFDIPDSKIVFNTVAKISDYPWLPVELIAFKAAQTINQSDIDHNLSNAKFVGALAQGRWSLYRLSTLFELDKAFPNDTIITHRSELTQQNLSFIASNDLNEELEWVKQKQFDIDIGISNDYPIGNVNYTDAFHAYPLMWNRYQVEVVMETDEYQDQWFTDKIGRCLATGKPFVLLKGQHSLKNLRTLGFKTFDQYIDESYDNCVLPHQRIRAMIDSLKTLYHSSQKAKILQAMQETAKENCEIFKQYVQSKV